MGATSRRLGWGRGQHANVSVRGCYKRCRPRAPSLLLLGLGSLGLRGDRTRPLKGRGRSTLPSPAVCDCGAPSASTCKLTLPASLHASRYQVGRRQPAASWVRTATVLPLRIPRHLWRRPGEWRRTRRRVGRTRSGRPRGGRRRRKRRRLHGWVRADASIMHIPS